MTTTSVHTHIDPLSHATTPTSLFSPTTPTCLFPGYHTMRAHTHGHHCNLSGTALPNRGRVGRIRMPAGRLLCSPRCHPLATFFFPSKLDDLSQHNTHTHTHTHTFSINDEYTHIDAVSLPISPTCLSLRPRPHACSLQPHPHACSPDTIR